jgi:hypothetical protein
LQALYQLQNMPIKQLMTATFILHFIQTHVYPSSSTIAGTSVISAEVLINLIK